MYQVTIGDQTVWAQGGQTLLRVLQDAGIVMDAPCGGNGTCGKCTVYLDGTPVSACQTLLSRDCHISVPRRDEQILTDSGTLTGSLLCAAVDIGTTTVVCYLLGSHTATAACPNPQRIYGADVVTRLQWAQKNGSAPLHRGIRDCVASLLSTVCNQAGCAVADIRRLCIVGNPCMQQLYFDIPLQNLVSPPFPPAIGTAITRPELPGGTVCTLPDLSGYLGADILAATLYAGATERERPFLLLDIGTNGEMVMGNAGQLVACATAAGPALEGAGITFGMSAQRGAIDHVFWEGDGLSYTVIGGGEPIGICGSGIVDAVAALLERGLMNHRGRLCPQCPEKDGQRVYFLTRDIFLTQSDIRSVQLAKGAIAAGICMLARQLGICVDDLDTLYLAGAFGCYMDPDAACRIGLLPPLPRERICVLGNAAGEGAKQIAAAPEKLQEAEKLGARIRPIDLATLPEFQHAFARHTGFSREVWT